MTRQLLLERVKEQFIAAGLENPASLARTCVSFGLNISPAKLIAFAEERVDLSQQNHVLDIANRMARHEPFAYIAGKCEFWGRAFEVSPATLIPRADTEILIETVLKIYKNRTQALRILDLGTGSGCILLTLLAEYPNAWGIGVDLSYDALMMAQKNARHLQLNTRAHFINGEWMNALATDAAIENNHTLFDIIVSNPPYIPSADIAHLDHNVRGFEPITALDGGETGLDAYRVIIPQAIENLADNGLFACEVGIGQAQAVEQLCREHGLNTFAAARDLAGIERVVGGVKNVLGF